MADYEDEDQGQQGLILTRSDKVPMRMPDGRSVWMPRDNMEKALARGYKMDGPTGDTVAMIGEAPGQLTPGDWNQEGVIPDQPPPERTIMQLPVENYRKAMDRGWRLASQQEIDDYDLAKAARQNQLAIDQGGLGERAGTALLNFVNTATGKLPQTILQMSSSSQPDLQNAQPSDMSDMPAAQQQAILEQMRQDQAAAPPPEPNVADKALATFDELNKRNPNAALLGTLPGYAIGPMAKLGGIAGKAATAAVAGTDTVQALAGAGRVGQATAGLLARGAGGAAEMAAMEAAMAPAKLSQKPLGTEALLSEISSSAMVSLLAGGIGAIAGGISGFAAKDQSSLLKALTEHAGQEIDSGEALHAHLDEFSKGYEADLAKVMKERAADIDNAPAVKALREQLERHRAEASVRPPEAPATAQKIQAVDELDRAVGDLLPSRRHFSDWEPLGPDEAPYGRGASHIASAKLNEPLPIEPTAEQKVADDLMRQAKDRLDQAKQALAQQPAGMMPDPGLIMDVEEAQKAFVQAQTQAQRFKPFTSEPARATDDAISHVKALTDSKLATATPQEQQILADYVRKLVRREPVETTPEVQAALDKVKLDRPTQYGTLYRGTTMAPNEADSLIEGRKFAFGYNSPTSYNDDYATMYAEEAAGGKVLHGRPGGVEGRVPVMFRITQADHGYSMVSDALGQDLQEVVIPKDAEFRVVNTSRAGSTKIVDLEQVRDQATPIMVKKIPFVDRAKNMTPDEVARAAFEEYKPKMGGINVLADHALEATMRGKSIPEIIQLSQQVAQTLREEAQKALEKYGMAAVRGLKRMPSEIATKAAYANKVADAIDGSVQRAINAQDTLKSLDQATLANDQAWAEREFKRPLDQSLESVLNRRIAGARTDTAQSLMYSPIQQAPTVPTGPTDAGRAWMAERRASFTPGLPSIPGVQVGNITPPALSPNVNPSVRQEINPPAPGKLGLVAKMARAYTKSAAYGAAYGASKLVGLAGGGLPAFAARHLLGQQASKLVDLLPSIGKKFLEDNVAAVDGLFSGGTKEAAGSPATKVGSLLDDIAPAFKGRDDRGSGVKEALPRTLAGAVKEYSDQVTKITGNPDALRMRLEQLFAPLGAIDPDLRDQAIDGLMQRLQFLNDKLPKNPDSNTLSAAWSKWVPDGQQASEAARYIKASEKPAQTLLQELHTGRITKETIETVQTLFPRLFQWLQGRIMSRVLDVKQLSYARRVALSEVFGIGLEPTLDPEIAQGLLAMQQSDSGSQETNKQGGYMVPRKINLDTATKGTPAQRLSS